MERIIVIVIVAAAAVFSVLSIRKKAKRKSCGLCRKCDPDKKKNK